MELLCLSVTLKLKSSKQNLFKESRKFFSDKFFCSSQIQKESTCQKSLFKSTWLLLLSCAKPLSIVPLAILHANPIFWTAPQLSKCLEQASLFSSLHVIRSIELQYWVMSLLFITFCVRCLLFFSIFPNFNHPCSCFYLNKYLIVIE